jgi:hypothetical protein
MKKSARFLMGLLVPAFMLAGVAANPALAQDKAKDAKAAPAAKAEKGKAAQKVLLENNKVRVQEVMYKPGDENTSVASSSSRVVRALKGGTLMRTYADGKTEKSEWKTGEVKFIESSKVAYRAKNVGKTDVQLYVVILK